MACAHQDGIVGNKLEKPTKGRYGITALPLLTGQEEKVEGGLVKYIRRGLLSDMHVSLLAQVGRQIRILRGHTLMSPYAPSAGIRYDGLYVEPEAVSRRECTDTSELDGLSVNMDISWTSTITHIACSCSWSRLMGRSHSTTF
jgi:hypothetical protein